MFYIFSKQRLIFFFLNIFIIIHSNYNTNCYIYAGLRLYPNYTCNLSTVNKQKKKLGTTNNLYFDMLFYSGFFFRKYIGNVLGWERVPKEIEHRISIQIQINKVISRFPFLMYLIHNRYFHNIPYNANGYPTNEKKTQRQNETHEIRQKSMQKRVLSDNKFISTVIRSVPSFGQAQIFSRIERT